MIGNTRSGILTPIFVALLVLASWTSAYGQKASSATADLILYNGVIWTVDSLKSTAQAVAIRDAKFVAVGSNSAAMKLRGPRTEIIDLRGACHSGFQR